MTIFLELLGLQNWNLAKLIFMRRIGSHKTVSIKFEIKKSTEGNKQSKIAVSVIMLSVIRNLRYGIVVTFKMLMLAKNGFKKIENLNGQIRGKLSKNALNNDLLEVVMTINLKTYKAFTFNM